MAYSATLANMRGLLSDHEHHRLLNLFSRAGLSMDHPQFNAEILDKGTKAILRTRDGKLRAAVPHPLGNCIFLNDVDNKELIEALEKHKSIMKEYPRNGVGIEAFVDASDTGYTLAGQTVEEAKETNGSFTKEKAINGANGHHANGNSNGLNGSVHHAVKGLNGTANGVTNGTNGTNGHTKGVANGH